MRSLLVVSAAALLAGSVAACSSSPDVATGGAGTTGTTTHVSSTSGHGVTSVTSSTGGPDIGQPSDQYPAPHPAPPQVVSSAGPVLAAAQIQPIVFQSDDPTMRAQIADFSNKVIASSYWTAIATEYGVGAATSAAPIVLGEAAPSTIDDSQIQAWLAAKLEGGDLSFPAPNASSLYVIYYPAGVTVTLSGGASGVEKSCQQFGGYHSNLVLDAAHGGLPVAYAVVPRCSSFNGFNGIDAVTAAASHELIEAVTDPLPMTSPAYSQNDDNHFYWGLAIGGGEVGDMCTQNDGADTSFPDLPFIVQRSWSNASAKAGHDPCVPRDTTLPYFAAVPVLPDFINFGGGLTVKGAKIPVGGQKTIDLELFSDAPTGGPFTVEAFDASMFQGGGQKLALSLDTDQGQNGQTLHLTIEVLAASQYKAEFFYVVASKGGHRNSWLGLVGN